MDDIASKIGDVLNSPDGMSKIMDLISQLGLKGGTSSTGAETAKSEPEEERAESGGGPGIDMNMLLNIQRLMSSMGKNDKNTELLMALKPHFSDERRHKVDDAVKILKLISVIPALTESGFFGLDKLFGGDRR